MQFLEGGEWPPVLPLNSATKVSLYFYIKHLAVGTYVHQTYISAL